MTPIEHDKWWRKLCLLLGTMTMWLLISIGPFACNSAGPKTCISNWFLPTSILWNIQANELLSHYHNCNRDHIFGPSLPRLHNGGVMALSVKNHTNKRGNNVSVCCLLSSARGRYNLWFIYQARTHLLTYSLASSSFVGFIDIENNEISTANKV